MSIYMQQWRVLVRPRDHALLDVATDEIRRLYVWTRTRASLHLHFGAFGH
jgi:hypothetical protein